MGILSMGKSPRPICDVCNKRVAEMDIDQYSGERFLTVTVRCHGESETMQIPNWFAYSMDKNTEVGRAFVRKRLEDKKEEAKPQNKALPPPKGE